MKNIKRLLIWDFDGTLGYRVGGWTGALLEVLRQETIECTVTADQLRPHLQAGFPWHTPDQICLVERSADQWWNYLDDLFERAFAALGIDGERALRMAKAVRNTYPDPQHWRLFDDAIPAIEVLSAQGWTHALLSNHAPELRSILNHLQLNIYFAEIFNSAETGYEKPHPQAFRNVLTALNNPGIVWMIGDSLNADIRGAEAVGIPAILVRKNHEATKYSCDNLSDLCKLFSS